MGTLSVYEICWELNGSNWFFKTARQEKVKIFNTKESFCVFVVYTLKLLEVIKLSRQLKIWHESKECLIPIYLIDHQREND